LISSFSKSHKHFLPAAATSTVRVLVDLILVSKAAMSSAVLAWAFSSNNIFFFMLGNVFPERFPTLLSNNIFSNLHQRNNLIQKLVKVRNSITSAQKIQRERNKTYILQTFRQYTTNNIAIDSPGVTRHQGNIAHSDFMGQGSANLNLGGLVQRPHH
jgi:hypothetical protein